MSQGRQSTQEPSTRSHRSDVDNVSYIRTTVDKVRRALLSLTEYLLPHSHSTSNTTSSSITNPHSGTSNSSHLPTLGHDLSLGPRYHLCLQNPTCSPTLCFVTKEPDIVDVVPGRGANPFTSCEYNFISTPPWMDVPWKTSKTVSLWCL